MKIRVFIVCGLLGIILPGLGQGRVRFANLTAPTLLWSVDGPRAGPDILGQLLAGPTPENLLAVGNPAAHDENGFIFAEVVTVPTVPCDELGYVQMVVWDGSLWGANLGDVPLGQIGATDIVGVFTSCAHRPIAAPAFTQSAIVPIPEPSLWLLGLVALVLASGRRMANLGTSSTAA